MSRTTAAARAPANAPSYGAAPRSHDDDEEDPRPRRRASTDTTPVNSAVDAPCTTAQHTPSAVSPPRVQPTLWSVPSSCSRPCTSAATATPAADPTNAAVATSQHPISAASRLVGRTAAHARRTRFRRRGARVLELALGLELVPGCGVVVDTAVVVLDSGVSRASGPGSGSSSSSSFWGPGAVAGVAVAVAVAVVVMLDVVSVSDANDAVDGVGVAGVVVMMGMAGAGGR